MNEIEKKELIAKLAEDGFYLKFEDGTTEDFTEAILAKKAFNKYLG